MSHQAPSLWEVRIGAYAESSRDHEGSLRTGFFQTHVLCTAQVYLSCPGIKPPTID